MDLLPPVAIAPAATSQPSIPRENSAHASTFKAVLTELAARMDRGEAAVNAVADAAPRLGPGGELLALQASVYRYTETFEVAAKLVDKASSAVKTTLQGQ